MSKATYTTILVTEIDEVRTIMLNRPDRRNALTPQMQEELIAAMREASEDACRVVVFAGAGESFCAGLDLNALQSMKDKTAIEHREDAGRVALLFRTLYELPKPTIAAVQGPAIAGGTGLATLCDITLAVPAARFGYTEVRIGFVPAVVSAFLALQVGDKRSRELLLTGRLFGAEEAQRLGLVTEIVEPDRLSARVLEFASMLKANSPESQFATKQMLAAQNKLWLDAAIEEALATQAKSRGTYDFQEGVTAFLEKRAPTWKMERQ